MDPSRPRTPDPTQRPRSIRPPASARPAADVPSRPARRAAIAAACAGGSRSWRSSIALVAILAGSALFMSGYTLGAQAAAAAGDAGLGRRGVPAVLGHLPHDQRPVRRRRRRPERAGPGRDQGDDRRRSATRTPPYLSSTEYRESLQGISGQFEGIGAEIATQAPDGTEGCTPLGAACRLVVTKPLAGSPAERAGLHAGDVVLSVDGTSLDGLTVDGRAGPDPRAEGLDRDADRSSAARARRCRVPITRDVVQSREVVSKVLADGTVGYVRVAGFSDAAADEVVAALAEHLAAGRTKLILDLRGNPGGYVTAARKIASQFIGSGVLFWEQDAKGNQVPTDGARRRRRDRPGRSSVVVPDRRRQRVGERDRRRGAPGLEAGDARRPDSRSARAPSSSGRS